MSSNKTKSSTPAKTSAYKYRRHDYRKRNKLIEMVKDQHKSLASSAKKLGIPQTTARLIMKTWNEEKRVFQKKADRIKREKKEALKLSQARKREKQRLKRLAKRQASQTELPQQPQSQIQAEENQQSVVQQPGIPLLPQISLEAACAYSPWTYQIPYYFVYPYGFYY